MRYLYVDLLRICRSRRCFLGIGGVFFTLLFAHVDNKGSLESVLFMSQYILDGIPFFMCMIFSILTYSDSLCEDVRSKYYRLEIVRGSTKKYCVSRILSIFFSAFFSMMLGYLLFVVFLKLQFPWKMPQDSVFDGLVRSGAFRAVLQSEHYLFYYILVSIQLGILAGVLALFSACISLKIRNRMLIYTIPVVFFYFLTNATYRLPQKMQYLELYKIYIPSYNVWNNDLLSFLWALAIGILGTLCFGSCIFHQIKGALENE